MTDMEMERRNQRASKLRAIKVDDQFFVESSEKKIAYIVNRVNGGYACTCGDYASNHKKDQEFKCKHILAVLNGNVVMLSSGNGKKPKLDDRFISNIQGKDFVLYAGLLDLAHQMGLSELQVEALQYPTQENNQMAICKATAVSKNGDMFVDVGDANPTNTSQKIAPYPAHGQHQSESKSFA
jgi:ribosomal protein RSM22 (predicted rRNA methylase)